MNKNKKIRISRYIVLSTIVSDELLENDWTDDAYITQTHEEAEELIEKSKQEILEFLTLGEGEELSDYIRYSIVERSTEVEIEKWTFEPGGQVMYNIC